MKKLFIDFESRSRADLKKVGVWAYAAHPSTEILCVAYAFEGGPIKIWRHEEAVPADLEAGLRDPNVVLVAHNAHFEFAMYHAVMVRAGAPPIEDPSRWDCTLARAALCNLPLSLENLGAALEIPSQKDMAGRAVMLKLSKPDKNGNFVEDPALYEMLCLYCMGDVAAEIEIDSKLPPMPPAEKDVWALDLLINRRGVRMDIPLAMTATRMVDALTQKLNARLSKITGGLVEKATRVEALKNYLSAHGVKGVESLDKQAVTELLARPGLAPDVRAVLDIRRQVGKTSTSKYQAILDVAGDSGRARGLLQYHGASTGRWAGRLVQPHNFPKGVSEQEQREIIALIGADNPDAFAVHYGSGAMDALAGALRGTMTADPDEELIVADYSTIEPRVLFWLAGDLIALDAYRTGSDLYLDLAETVFGRRGLNKYEHPFERSVGKFGILGCGYGMGAPRFQAQCAAAQPPVNIDLALAEKVVRAYRDKYPQVPALWKSVEAAAKRAVKNPGSLQSCCGGRVSWGMSADRRFLVCRLPNGKHLRYFKPFLKATEYGTELRYWAPGLGGRLEEQKTYGGSLVENIVQAIARELLAAAMLRLELAGYDTLFHVHDEIVSRLAGWIGASQTIRAALLQGYIATMCETPSWAAGCPIAAEGWIGKRYRK